MRPNRTIHSQHWWWYLLITLVFYTGYKNMITRTAHVKELVREQVCGVTPRTRRAHVDPVSSIGPDP